MLTVKKRFVFLLDLDRFLFDFIEILMKNGFPRGVTGEQGYFIGDDDP